MAQARKKSSMQNKQLLRGGAHLLDMQNLGQAGAQASGQNSAQGFGQAGQGQKMCYELVIPPGMTLSEAQQAIFEEQARELGLDNASAQKLLEIAYRNEDAHRSAYAQQVDSWAEEVRHDKDMGGSAMQSTLSYAKAALSRFDPSGELLEILQDTGYANHPKVIRFLASIGKAHAEDAVYMGQMAPSAQPRHERLYGKYNK